MSLTPRRTAVLTTVSIAAYTPDLALVCEVLGTRLLDVSPEPDEART